MPAVRSENLLAVEVGCEGSCEANSCDPACRDLQGPVLQRERLAAVVVGHHHSHHRRLSGERAEGTSKASTCRHPHGVATALARGIAAGDGDDRQRLWREVVLQCEAAFCADLHGKCTLLPLDASSRRLRRVFNCPEGMKGTHNQGGCECSCSIAQMALMGPPEVRATLQRRVANGGSSSRA